MSKPLTKQTIDRSDEKNFSFSFFCDICGKEWRSPAVPFETNGLTIEHEEARTLLWTKEHGAAFEAANVEAVIKYNRCEKCGQRVCDNCFRFDEKKEVGLCKKCV